MVVVVEVVVEKITCRMLCLGLRPKLPAIVEGGHRRREVEETSSYGFGARSNYQSHLRLVAPKP